MATAPRQRKRGIWRRLWLLSSLVVLPNPISLVAGKEHALAVDNGLGEYLTRLGLAKTFVASATWREAPYAPAGNAP